MTLKQLKDIINQLPPECDDYDVVFGSSFPSEEVVSVEVVGSQIEISL